MVRFSPRCTLRKRKPASRRAFCEKGGVLTSPCSQTSGLPWASMPRLYIRSGIMTRIACVPNHLLPRHSHDAPHITFDEILPILAAKLGEVPVDEYTPRVRGRLKATGADASEQPIPPSAHGDETMRPRRTTLTGAPCAASVHCCGYSSPTRWSDMNCTIGPK